MASDKNQKILQMSKISQIQEVFPGLDSTLISQLLDDCHGETEQVVGRLLENDLPSHIATANQTREESTLPSSIEISSSTDLAPPIPDQPGTSERDIYLLTTPLSQSANYNILKNHSGRRTNHWAVRIGDLCHNVVIAGPGSNTTHEYSFVPFDAWKDDVKVRRKATFQEFYLGRTTWTDDQIEDCSHRLWTKLFRSTYDDRFRNCQEFVLWLYRCIAIDVKDDQMTARNQSIGLQSFVKDSPKTIAPFAAAAYLGSRSNNAAKAAAVGSLAFGGFKVAAMAKENWAFVDQAIEFEKNERARMGYPPTNRRRRDIMWANQKIWEH